MYQCWTLLLVVTMHAQSCLAAVATLPNVSSSMKLNTHVQNTTQEESSNKYSTTWPDDVQLGCKELRAKRYISDGFCTSLKPIKEVVCAGHCMPIKEQNMPWWAEFTKYWARPKFKEWRCVEAVTKYKKVQLMCENGETRTYKIKIVKSCRCKSYEREPNRTDIPSKRRRGKRQNKDSEKRRREALERKRAKREKRRLEREKAKKDRRRLKESSQELRRHSRHSIERRGSKRRHGGRRSENTDTLSDSVHRNSQLLINNESPTV